MFQTLPARHRPPSLPPMLLLSLCLICIQTINRAVPRQKAKYPCIYLFNTCCMPRKAKNSTKIHQIAVKRKPFFEPTFFKSEVDLGYGSFGEVKKFREYRHPDQFSFGKEYAIKLPIANPSDMFQNETQILKYISQHLIKKGHNHFIEYVDDWPIFEKCFKGESPTQATEDETNVVHGCNILMEYCPHHSLKRYLERRNRNRACFPLDHDEVLYFAWEILRGVSQLHGAGVMHRDLKPDNMLLDKDFNLKICDFGISVQDSEPNFTRIQDAGTQPYMAPQIMTKEQRLNSEQLGQYNCLVDEWSAGVSILEIMTNHTKVPHNLSCLKVQSKGSPEDEAKLKTILSRLLEKNPEKRVPAQEILKEHHLFEAVLGNEKRIREKLLQRKNLHKVQAKRVFHIDGFGYCVVLSNCKTFLVPRPRKGQPEIVQLDQKLLEQRIRNNWEGRVFEGKPYLKRRREIDAVCYMVPQEYLTFMQRWRCDDAIDDYAGDTTQVSTLEIVHDRALCLKLSNGSVQFFFASEAAPCCRLDFNLRVSFNYNNSKNCLVSFSNNSGALVQKQFSQFLQDKHRREFALYIKSTFKMWAMKMQKELALKRYLISY